MAFCTRSFPHNLVPEIGRAEYLVEHYLQVVAGGGVAVQVQGAGGLEHPVQLYQAGGHHHQVGHHVVVAQGLVQRAYQAHHLGRPVGNDVLVGVLRRLRP